MDGRERLTLIQLALGKVSVDFMRQSKDVVMPTEALLETASQIEEIWAQEIADLESQLTDRDAEIDRLRADLVWSVRKGVMVSHDENLRPCVWFDVHRGVEYDGTPDSICRAVREARTNVA